MTVRASVAVCLFASLPAIAGSLNPPAGVVAPTLKTIQEAEPRTIVYATNTPGDADSVFKISQPGSYYLDANLAGEVGKHGIEVASTDVTIDLMGFALIGVPGSLSGVFYGANLRNGAVVNGSIRDWDGSGVVISDTSLVRDLRIFNTTQQGIQTSATCVVTRCVVHGTDGDGIKTLDGCVVSACTVQNAVLDGIEVGANSSVLDCAVESGDSDGIHTSAGCTVSRCTSAFNLGDGIEVSGFCVVEGNSCRTNGTGGAGAGIRAFSANNRIVGNICNANQRGIECFSGFNHLQDNTVHANVDNYFITGGSPNQHKISILLFELPETIDFAADVRLAGTLTLAAAGAGITIAADDVTIDLGGFALVGNNAAAAASDGIIVSGSRRNITIRNGAVRSWGDDGIDAFSAVSGLTIEGVNSSSNLGDGIVAGTVAAIRECTTTGNGARGVVTGAACTITACTTNGNTTGGITTGTRCAVTGCSAMSSVISGGIVVGDGSSVIDCVAGANAGDGIVMGSRCQARGNTCDGNGVGGGVGAGVNLLGAQNRVESNLCTGADFGILAAGIRNVIVRNTCASNTTNWSIAADNVVGPIFDRTAPGSAAISGNSAPSSLGTTEPNANFTH